jgi:hypothetical protein
MGRYRTIGTNCECQMGLDTTWAAQIACCARRMKAGQRERLRRWDSERARMAITGRP